MRLEDLLCDRCLYQVESHGGEYLVADMCDRCKAKIMKHLLDIAEEAQRLDS